MVIAKDDFELPNLLLPFLSNDRITTVYSLLGLKWVKLALAIRP